MADWRYEYYFLVMTIFHQGHREPTLIWGGEEEVSIELPKYAINIFIKLPEFYWMRFKSCQLPYAFYL